MTFVDFGANGGAPPVSLDRSRIRKRCRTVLRVFSRHGFGLLAEHLGLPRMPVWPWRPGADKGKTVGRGERLRMACEELGPAFVKVGQMLSTRADLLPPDVIAALERLQDQVEPAPFEQIRGLIEQEIGSPIQGRFQQIDLQPIAAASLGQVHRAVLIDGQSVVIKVQRPGVQEQVELDLQVLLYLANVAARRLKWVRAYDLPGVAKEFAAMLLAELDYVREGRNADQFRAHFAGDPLIRFPQVYWDHTTARLLTLAFVSGIRVTDGLAFQRAALSQSVVASRLAGALFQMILRDGFFHADPHPGNLFVNPDGGITFVDMGMVGELTPAMRSNVVDYVLGVVSRDADRAVEAILRMGLVAYPVNRAELRREVERLQRKYGEVPVRQVQFGPALRETLAVARRFAISFPSGYAVLMKSMTTLEAVVRQMDPQATLVGLAAPYAEEILQGRHSPRHFFSRLFQEFADAGRYSVRIPRQISNLLMLLEEGEWRLGVDHFGLDPALRRLSAITNRLSIAILLASLIIGTALVSSRSERSILVHYPIAEWGFILIGLVGLWLVVSILSSKRL